MTTKKLPKGQKVAIYNLKSAVQAAEANGATRCTTTLDPSVSPKLLGGQPTKEVENAFLGEHYAKIHRPSAAELPGPHSGDAEFTNDYIKQAYKHIYGGNVTFVIPDEQTNLDFAERNEFDRDVLFSYLAILESEEIEFQGVAVETMVMNTLVINALDPEFEYSLFLSQKTILFRRAMHLFLRCMGTKLPESVFRLYTTQLQNEYTKANWWREALDVAMIRADVALSQGHHLQWKVEALEKVAQMLGANASFQSSSLVYQDIINSFWDDSIAAPGLGRSYLAGFCMYASVASQRAMNFLEGEELLVKGLNLEFVVNANGSNFPWSANDNNKLALTMHLCDFYRYWAEVKVEGRDPRFYMTLIALLVVGKASSPKPGIDFFKEQLAYVADFSRKTAHSVLKTKYQSKKAAQRVLTNAVLDGSTAAFRSTVLSASALSPNQVYRLGGDTGLTPEEEKDYTKHHRDTARQYYQIPPGGSTGRLFAVYCGLPTCGADKSLDDLQFCPCKMIGYCNKDCQVADWKRHKKNCVWQAKKKAGKKQNM